MELDPPSFPWWGWSDFIYSAFWELSTNRSSGMAVGPIPSTAIDAYTAQWLPDDADLLRICIRRMDAAFMAVTNPNNDDTDGSEPVSARDAFRSATNRRRVK